MSTPIQAMLLTDAEKRRATAARKRAERTNPGPVRKRGGARKNAGRPSLAATKLKQLALNEGKTTDQILLEVYAGYPRALRTISESIPLIIEQLTARAIEKKGNPTVGMFLLSLYLKHTTTIQEQVTNRGVDSPLTRLRDSMRSIMDAANAQGLIRAPQPIVDATFRLVDDDNTTPTTKTPRNSIPDGPAQPNPNGDSVRPFPN